MNSGHLALLLLVALLLVSDRSAASAASRAAVEADFAPALPVYGSTPWAILLCNFADRPAEPAPRSFYEAMRSDTYPGLDHYWQEASYGHINLAGSEVRGWYTLPEPSANYRDRHRAVAACMEAADADVYFPDFYGLIFVFNFPYTGLNWGGIMRSALDGGIERAYPYASVLHTGVSPFNSLQHEMSHAYGLPHSWAAWNRYGNPWDVVSDNRHGCDYAKSFPVRRCVGPHTLAYGRFNLGWIPAERLYVAGAGRHTITLEGATQPGPHGHLLAIVPIHDSSAHFYTVEARRPVGYDANLPGAAVVIHEIGGPEYLQLLVDPSRYHLGDGDAAMWLPGEAFASAEADVIIAVDNATATGFVVTIHNGGNERRTMTLAPTADTKVKKSMPDANFGAQEYLVVRGKRPIWSALQFDDDALPPGVVAMTLRLYPLLDVTAAPGYAFTQPANSLCWPGSKWAESELTWQDFTPARCPGYERTYLSFSEPSVEDGWVTWDLTPYGTRHGLQKIMIMDSRRHMVYSSREGEAPPELVVDYLVPSVRPPGNTARAARTLPENASITPFHAPLPVAAPVRGGHAARSMRRVGQPRHGGSYER